MIDGNNSFVPHLWILYKRQRRWDLNFNYCPGRGFWKFIISLYTFTAYIAPRTVARKVLNVPTAHWSRHYNVNFFPLITIFKQKCLGDIYNWNKCSVVVLSPSYLYIIYGYFSWPINIRLAALDLISDRVTCRRRLATFCGCSFRNAKMWTNSTVSPPSLHSILTVRIRELSLSEENRFDSLFTVFTHSQPMI